MPLPARPAFWQEHGGSRLGGPEARGRTGVRAEQREAVEWPTMTLAAAIHGLFLALTWFHAAIPLWLWLPLAAWSGAWWGSFQHEALHGHPTRIRALNTALATPPFWLWLPFERYRMSHLTHHRDERLTDPIDDPESRYFTPEGWAALSPWARALVRLQGALLGRMLVGPFWSVGRFLAHEARQLAAGNRVARRIWAWHVLWVALWLGWVLGVCGVPAWQYLLGVVYGGLSLTLVRSFAEHRAHDRVENRTAIVEGAWLFGPLFLFNNLHVAHHRWPSVPWYRLPGLYRARRAELVALNGGLVYRGYADIARRFLLRPHDAPVHPLGRAPMSARDQAGSE